ncbi:MAG TPA: hypothetical protein VE463_01690 [Blastococcus sp.]|jgi:hypothetical protein|nr:hypothetical protein [Blastococcus sp.]
MTPSIRIEPQGAHEYVVRLQDGELVCVSWFHLTPDVLVELHVDEEAEGLCVRRTAEFLLRHQDVANFPDIVELEDVIATYDDFTEFLSAQPHP